MPQAQILNVSVSVRQGSVSVQGRTQDVFFSPEYLREYIYLYRSLLANLSALQVRIKALYTASSLSFRFMTWWNWVGDFDVGIVWPWVKTISDRTIHVPAVMPV